MSYFVTIGLEVRAQVNARTKLLCACRTSFDDEPNPHTCPVPPDNLRGLLALVEDGTLALNQANGVFAAMFRDPGAPPAGIAASLGFRKADACELESLIDAVIDGCPDEVAAVRAGNEKLLKFLTGQVMRSASTKPNPKQVTEYLRAKLL